MMMKFTLGLVAVIAMSNATAILAEDAKNNGFKNVKEIKTRSPNPELEKATKLITDMMARDASSIELMRQNFADTANKFNEVPNNIKCIPIDDDGVKAEWIVAPNAVKDRVLMFLHGGGYIVCSVDTHRELIGRLSRSARMRALGVEYRLAPEHPFPAAVDDSIAAYRWLIRTGIKPKNIVIAGDSAGGGLTLATLVALRDAGEPMPGAAVCMSPWVDLEQGGESMDTKAKVDPFVSKETSRFMAQQYLGDADPKNPLAAPLHADLKGLPPLLIQVGSNEALLSDATRIAKRAEDAGVNVSLEIWENMIHGWQIFKFLPEGRQATDTIGDFIRANIR